jgi:hypothetical protein
MASNKTMRERIDTGTDKRFVRRDEAGEFKESDDVGKSLAQDVKNAAKTHVLSTRSIVTSVYAQTAR